MSEKEVIGKLLDKLGVSKKVNSVVESPQTEFEDGELVSLDLSDLRLTSIPEDLFSNVTQLKRIHLSFNDITELAEKTFSGLSDLEFLNLYGNNLTRLPDNIFEGLENIEWLDLRSNTLEAIPKSIGKLDSLKYLFLQNNPLSDHEEFNWAADYHSKRDIKKFMPEFQEAMGLEVTMEKPLTREERAKRAQKRREAKQNS